MAGVTRRLDYELFKEKAGLLLANAAAPETVLAAASDLMRKTHDVPASEALEVLLVVYANQEGASDTFRAAGLILDMWATAPAADAIRPLAHCYAGARRSPRR